jgi:hypothetical protein
VTADQPSRDRDELLQPDGLAAAGIHLVVPAQDDDAAGGDPVCWAHLVCDECGAITSEGHRDGCTLA